MCKTNLMRLNELLESVDVPAFRKKVSPSLNNLKWLKKTLADSDNTELRRLLDLKPNLLFSAYEKT